MANILEDVVTNGDLKAAELCYYKEMDRVNSASRAGRMEEMDAGVQFRYSTCLVRSSYADDIKKGLTLLDAMIRKEGLQECRRDCLYFSAVGNARLKEYVEAQAYIKRLLNSEPNNRQAQELKNLIQKKLEHEAMVGAAAVGSTVLAVGGLIGLGIALLKKR